MKKKSLAALSMCAVMELSLTSCGFGAPKTPADMFEAYQKAIEDTGYSVDGGDQPGHCDGRRRPLHRCSC